MPLTFPKKFFYVDVDEKGTTDQPEEQHIACSLYCKDTLFPLFFPFHPYFFSRFRRQTRKGRVEDSKDDIRSDSGKEEGGGGKGESDEKFFSSSHSLLYCNVDAQPICVASLVHSTHTTDIPTFSAMSTVYCMVHSGLTGLHNGLSGI